MPADIIGAILGSILASGDQNQAQQYEQDALGQITGIGSAKYNAVNASQIPQIDPQLRSAMLQALQNYQQVGQSGFTPIDRAALAESQRQVADANRGNQEALLQRAGSQGGLGSANQLMAALTGQQGEFDRANQTGNQLAIAGRQRALQAYGQSAGLAGDIQNQQSAIDRYNAGLSQQASMYNSQLGRSQYLDNLQVAQDKAGAYNTAANQYQNRADATRGMYTGIGAGLDQTAMAAAGMGAFGAGPQQFAMGAMGGGRGGMGGYYGGGYGGGGGYGYGGSGIYGGGSFGGMPRGYGPGMGH